MEKYLSQNLRNICAEVGSVSQICREIGINRQQFNRYINGGGMPSAHNLRKIARFFDVPEADFFEPPETFIRRQIQLEKRTLGAPANFMSETFSEQARSLRKYLGFYHVHFQTPSWEGKVLRSLVWLYEQDGYVMTRLVERARSRDSAVRQRSTYRGMIAMRGNRIYQVEKELIRDGSIVETILNLSRRQQVSYLHGVSVGVAWRPHTVPYATRVVWKRIPERISARDALKACGVFPLESTQIDPTVRSYLQPQSGDSGSGMIT